MLDDARKSTNISASFKPVIWKEKRILRNVPISYAQSKQKI